MALCHFADDLGMFARCSTCGRSTFGIHCTRDMSGVCPRCCPELPSSARNINCVLARPKISFMGMPR